MKGLFKKVVASALALTMVAAMGVTALAAHGEMDNMVFSHYDLQDPNNPTKVYYEVINGEYTNKKVYVPAKAEWSAEGFEGVYPYQGYDRLYIDGEKQPSTKYNGHFAQWDRKNSDYMWQVTSPYNVWERSMTNVEGKGWQWDFGNERLGIADASLLTKTDKLAVKVKQEYLPYGFGLYNNLGIFVSPEEAAMYDYFDLTFEYIDKAVDVKEYVAIIEAAQYDITSVLSVAKLSEKDPITNQYVWSDEDIVDAIPVVYSKYYTAKYNNINNDGLATKNMALEYLLNPAWDWESEKALGYEINRKIEDYPHYNRVVYSECNATVEWAAPTYEKEYPHYMFQYLIVNGVELNGRDGKPAVLRYTGAKVIPGQYPDIRMDYEGAYQHVLKIQGIQ